MKLELKHIAPYLPYGVKFKFNKHYVEYHTLTPTSTLLCMSEYSKLLLRPMSDLYKEINGVVGIVQLAKIEICGYPRSSHSPQFKYEIHTSEWGQTYLKYAPYLLHGAFEFFYSKEDNSFKKYQCKDNVCQEVGYQTELFDYLFANHYDIYGLIDKGLAINLNDIQP